MSRIFLSHSSKDNFAAVAIGDWLKREGWDDVFLDLDPVQGIAPGERWEAELYRQASDCEAVLFLISQNWLASDWCRREYELARKLNKRPFIVLIEDMAIAALPQFLRGTHQAVLLGAGIDHIVFKPKMPVTHQEGYVTFSAEGLSRLKAGLARAGLDPKFFLWPPQDEPDRAPYRGLEALEAKDAGVFFGRDAPVIEALDALRGLGEAAPPRLFVILGASGAGKSSFLRAGLLPRLARDETHFLALPPIRPERAAVLGANGLVTTLTAAAERAGLALSRAQIREALESGRLQSILKLLATGVSPRTIVFAVDQAEELFSAKGAAEGQRLLELLAEFAKRDDPPIMALFAIRSDSYDALQHARPFAGFSQKPFSLPPMPRGSYEMVIQGPAQRLKQAGRKFEIEPALSQALLESVEGGAGDALPLLAFTLEQLYREHGGAGRITLDDYRSFGGLSGVFDKSLDRVFAAADKDERIPKDKEARLALLRRGLIPWLAGVDPETKTPRRRVARATQIPAEARPLIDLLVEQRLLTKDVDPASGETTVEPAHEALLRQWGGFKGWLDEDFGLLATLEGVQRAARDWDANARVDAWAAHGGARLEEADRLDLRPDLGAKLDAVDREYLLACRVKENKARAKEQALAEAEKRTARLTRVALLGAICLLLATAGAAVYGFQKAQFASAQYKIAEKGREDLKKRTKETEQRSAVLTTYAAQSYLKEGNPDQAVLLMLQSAGAFTDETVPDQIRIAFSNALQKGQRMHVKNLFSPVKIFETNDALLLFNTSNRDILAITNSVEPTLLVKGNPDDATPLKIGESSNKNAYIIVRDNLDVELIRKDNNVRQKLGTFPPINSNKIKEVEDDEVAIVDGELIVRTVESADVDGKFVYFQIFDIASQKALAGDINIDNAGIDVFRKGKNGELFGVDRGSNKLFAINRNVAHLDIRQKNDASQNLIGLKYGPCIASMAQALPHNSFKYMENMESARGAGQFKCKHIGNSFLIEVDNSTSYGGSRDDILFLPNGKHFDIRQALSGVAPERLSNHLFAWVGGYQIIVDDHDASPAKKKKTEVIAVLINRDVYVMERNPDADSEEDADIRWELKFEFKHQHAVEYARFIRPGKLLIIESGTGRIIVHDIDKLDERKNLLVGAHSDLIGRETPIKQLHVGTCAGQSVMGRDAFMINSAHMPDGREIVFDGAEVNSDDAIDEINPVLKHDILVKGELEERVSLGADVSCIVFSRDWKKLLILTSHGVELYDFDAVLKNKGLKGNSIGRIENKDAMSALFVDAAGDRIVIADDTNRVVVWQKNQKDNIWTSTEIYKGDFPVVYAETDADGRRLIILERAGEGEIHGILYSIEAKQNWLDLGSEYKFLAAMFSDDSEIFVTHRENGWSNVLSMKPLSELIALAEMNLSPDCRPPNSKQYRLSRCWPEREH